MPFDYILHISLASNILVCYFSILESNVVYVISLHVNGLVFMYNVTIVQHPSSGVAADLYQGSDQSTTPIASGIVCKVTSSSVSVAFDSVDLEWDGRYRLLQTFDEVTYKGLKR